MLRIFAPLAVGAAALVAGPSLAAVSITQTFDLSQATVTTVPGVPSITTIQQSAKLASPVAIAEGDAVDIKILFAGSQSVTMGGEISVSNILFAVLGSTATNVSSTGTLTLLGSGTASHPADYALTKTDVEGTDHVGQSYTYGDGTFAALPDYPASVTFTGLEWIGTIDDYSTPRLTTRNYDSVAITIKALSETVSGVPEPASWAMMGMGFAIVGTAIRKNRKSSVAMQKASV